MCRKKLILIISTHIEESTLFDLIRAPEKKSDLVAKVVDVALCE